MFGLPGWQPLEGGLKEGQGHNTFMALSPAESGCTIAKHVADMYTSLNARGERNRGVSTQVRFRGQLPPCSSRLYTFDNYLQVVLSYICSHKLQ